MRKFNDCNFFGTRPVKIPTLRDYPPRCTRSTLPPASPRPISHRPPPSRRQSAPPPARSRSSQRKHDCLFVPNLKEIEEVIDARRGKMRSVAAANATASLASPLAIGLLLMFLPPVAVVLVWQSSRFSHAARIAVTTYGMFAFIAMLAATVAALHG
jgi:hypothetical protein